MMVRLAPSCCPVGRECVVRKDARHSFLQSAGIPKRVGHRRYPSEHVSIIELELGYFRAMRPVAPK